MVSQASYATQYARLTGDVRPSPLYNGLGVRLSVVWVRLPWLMVIKEAWLSSCLFWLGADSAVCGGPSSRLWAPETLHQAWGWDRGH